MQFVTEDVLVRSVGTYGEDIKRRDGSLVHFVEVVNPAEPHGAAVTMTVDPGAQLPTQGEQVRVLGRVEVKQEARIARNGEPYVASKQMVRFCGVFVPAEA